MKPQAQSKGRSDLPYRAEQLTYELLALASRHFGTASCQPRRYASICAERALGRHASRTKATA